MTDGLEESQAGSAEDVRQAWRDPRLPTSDRVADLIGRMTLEEKVHQLVGFWAAPSSQPSDPVAPMQNDMGVSTPPLEHLAKNGLGQFTRIYGTAPVAQREGLATLAALQSQVMAAGRFGIPAIVHEECLTGVMTLGATVFPSPLAWGASFDPALVEEMATAIATTMRRLGAHQGLAPVVDVTRDYRWGRTEETIGEDPYLVGVVGTAYVRGLERSGIAATLKHFAGYSASRAGRNHAPAPMGPREFADVILEPFVMALREGRPRSVMAAYNDVDNVPAHADERLLTDVLRDELGFTGMVVADYFGIAFLERTHRIAGSPAEAAAGALRAGVDVELPAVHCYGEPLLDAVRYGAASEEWVDRSASRVLALKCELGLLDQRYERDLAELTADPGDGDLLDPPEHRDIAARLAEESVVLLDNDGTLPLRADVGRLAVVGPLADTADGMLGCYTFPRHHGDKLPSTSVGVRIPTLVEALRAELPGTTIDTALGCGVDDEPGDDDAPGSVDSGIAEAVRAAQAADACVLVLGDRAGVFGRGTSGEGCDAATLALPGRQAELARAVLAAGTPTVLVLLSGRTYALDGIEDRAAAVLQGFFPGEEGASAVAGIIAGRVEPSGRLPVCVPRHAGSQPGTYLHAFLGGPTDVSSVDPTPRYAFGHGLTWTTFAYAELTVTAAHDLDSDGSPSVPTDGAAQVAVTLRNTGERPGTEVVQLYLADPVASVVRPVRMLAGFARVRLEPGQAARVGFTVHADRTSFTGRDLRRIVEPGEIQVAVGPSSSDLRLRGSFRLDGPERELGPDRVLNVPVKISPP